jgi:hypothetical protein
MELHPRRIANWDESPGGVIIHAPRGRLLTFVSRRLGRSDFVRVNLDELGTFVWRKCDGATSVWEIVREVETVFSENRDSTGQRVATFLNRLAREKLVSFHPKSTDRNY